MLRKGINYIYAVYLERSFSKAAQKLYVSQPALSAAIQKEEERWGCVFFDRSSSPIELTQAGKCFIEAIERIRKEQRKLEWFYKNFLLEQQKTVSIGAPAFFCTYMLPSIVKNYNARHPQYKVNVIEAGDNDLRNSINTDAIDMCVTVEKWRTNSLSTTVICKEDIVLAVPASFTVNNDLKEYQLGAASLENGYSLRKDCLKININKFKAVPFLLLKKGNDMYDRAYRIFRQGGCLPNVIMTLEQMMTSYHMACAGLGATLIRAGLMKQENRGLCFYGLESKDISRNINIVWKKSKTHSLAVTLFREYMCDFIKWTDSSNDNIGHVK